MVQPGTVMGPVGDWGSPYTQCALLLEAVVDRHMFPLLFAMFVTGKACSSGDLPSCR